MTWGYFSFIFLNWKEKTNEKMKCRKMYKLLVCDIISI